METPMKVLRKPCASNSSPRVAKKTKKKKSLENEPAAQVSRSEFV
jgi:hypothetical protein